MEIGGVLGMLGFNDIGWDGIVLITVIILWWTLFRKEKE